MNVKPLAVNGNITVEPDSDRVQGDPRDRGAANPLDPLRCAQRVCAGLHPLQAAPPRGGQDEI
jgi:hypothetical protein